MIGFEPITSCLQSIHSTVELHPLYNWSERIRTFESRYQKPTPYPLATLQKPLLGLGNNGLEPLTASL